jgi:hypothetical protein
MVPRPRGRLQVTPLFSSSGMRFMLWLNRAQANFLAALSSALWARFHRAPVQTDVKPFVKLSDSAIETRSDHCFWH